MKTKSRRRVAVVGAAGFIARAFVERYRDEFDWCLIGRRPADAIDCVVDLADPGSISALAPAAVGPIDALLFLQGLKPQHGPATISDAQFVEMLRVNLVGPTMVLQRIRDCLAPGCCVVFCSSIAAKKGSYDPSYAAAKAALGGLVQSLSGAYKDLRFNTVSLGLVEGSPVHRGMTADFVEKHRNAMFARSLITVDNVSSVLHEIITNTSLQLTDIALDGGYRL